MSEWKELPEPKVWASRFPRSLDHVSFSWSTQGKKIEFVRSCLDRYEKVGSASSPDFLYFRRDHVIPETIRDAFKIVDGLRIISPALRDIFDQFDLSGVQFFEVPIYADESRTPTGLPNHHVLNVYGVKDALIPELSENIEKPVMAGHEKPIPNANWWPTNDLDDVALNSSALEGADIWRDLSYDRTLFFSDPLKQAIDAADLKTRALSFAPTRIFTKQS